MIRPFEHAARARRGTILAIFTILIPLGIVLLLTFLTRVEVAYRQTANAEQHAQARLLAQSALAYYQVNPQAVSAPVTGELSGAGTYRLWTGQTPDGRRMIHAEGAAPSRQAAVICRLEAVSRGESFDLLSCTASLDPAKNSHTIAETPKDTASPRSAGQ